MADSTTPRLVALVAGPLALIFIGGCFDGSSPPEGTRVTEPLGLLSLPPVTVSGPTTLVFHGPGTFHARLAFAQKTEYDPPFVPLAETESGNNNMAPHWVIATPESFLAEMLRRSTCGLQTDNSPPPTNLWNPHPTGASSGLWNNPFGAGVWHFFVHVDIDVQVIVKHHGSDGGSREIGAGPRMDFNESAPYVRITSFRPQPTVVSPNAPHRVEFEQMGSTAGPAFLVAYFETQGGPWTNSSGNHGLWAASGEKCAVNSWRDDPTEVVQDASFDLNVFVMPGHFDFRWAGYFQTPATTKTPANEIWGHLLELGSFEPAA